ncbi:hypothetical protein DY000_02028686 [Brassica cretica]|uniref:Uncharacterized protein n=1 Tax=Brassica cretica TaxID=69181 RepID=A0ABQ7DQY4_BRACR|nr:hypothetical protein DY000_02028686 [Brassica cretica]
MSAKPPLLETMKLRLRLSRNDYGTRCVHLSRMEHHRHRPLDGLNDVSSAQLDHAKSDLYSFVFSIHSILRPLLQF